MDLKARKYQFIQELFSIERESILDILEDVLKKEKQKDLQISKTQKKELDARLDSYEKNPENILDWEDVKNDW